MFEKIFETEEAQHARHVAWAKAHPEEMKALILAGLRKTSRGPVGKYGTAYQYAVMVWQHRWFWDDSPIVLIDHTLAHMRDCRFTDFIFVVPAWTDEEIFPDEEKKFPWTKAMAESIYHRYITCSQDVVKHYHMDQWKKLIEEKRQLHPCGSPRRRAEMYETIVKHLRRYIRRPHTKFQW